VKLTVKKAKDLTIKAKNFPRKSKAKKMEWIVRWSTNHTTIRRPSV